MEELNAYIRKVFSDKDYTAEKVPFLDYEVFVAFKRYKYSLIKKARPFDLEITTFSRPFVSDKEFIFTQKKNITLPEIRILELVKVGIMRSLSNTITRAIRESITDYPIATECDDEEFYPELKKVIFSSRMVPEETKELDIYAELPMVVTTGKLLHKSRYMDKPEETGVVLMDSGKVLKGEAPCVIIINYEYLRKFIENIENHIEHKLGK